MAGGTGLLGFGVAGDAAAAVSEETLSEYRNFRAQEASKVWERGYRWRPDRAIAIGDTGVDARHPDLGPWNNARVVNTGDGYDLVRIEDGGEERTVADLGPYSGTIGPGAADANAAQYARHAFTTPSGAEQVEATLSWTANTQDLDFYLEDSQGNTVGSSTQHRRRPEYERLSGRGGFVS